MRFGFEADAEPTRMVEVTLANKSAGAPVGLVADLSPGSTADAPQPRVGVEAQLLPLTVRIGTGVKQFGNGVEVAVTQVELYDPTKPGDKERAAAAAFDWFQSLMQNRGGQLSMMLAEVQRVNPNYTFDMRQGWQPAGTVAQPAGTVAQPAAATPNPFALRTFP